MLSWWGETRIIERQGGKTNGGNNSFEIIQLDAELWNPITPRMTGKHESLVRDCSMHVSNAAMFIAAERLAYSCMI